MTAHLVAVVAAVLLAQPPRGAPPRPQPEHAQAKAAMIAALVVTISTQPWVASPPAFRDPANARAITGALDTLAVMPHAFYASKAGTADALATLYARQVERAKREFEAKNYEAARQRVRNVTGLCLGCHLRQPMAPKLEEAARMVDLLKLPALERAYFYAATRQFDRALALWKGALVDPRNEAEAFEQAQALRIALDVAVRGKDDPRAALALLESQDERSDDLPEFVATQITQAIKEVRAWDAEKLVAARTTPGQLFARAKALVTLSGAASTSAADERHFIGLLRAAGYLDEALQRDPDAPWRGEALYLLGVVSASVNDPLLWELESMYFEACIRENPGTPLSRQCYARLYSRAWFSWAGYENIPAEQVGWLGELRALTR